MLLDKIREEAKFGSGLQAIAILDKFFDYEARKIVNQAASLLQALVCTDVGSVGQYVAKFKLLLEQMKAAGQPLADSMILDLLQKQLRNVKGLEAMLANFQARPHTEQTGKNILEALETVYAIHRRYNPDVGKGGGAKGGKKGGKKRKGKKGEGEKTGKGDGKDAGYWTAVANAGGVELC